MLEGLDVSRWNGPPSLTGLAFAFARATYATGVDPKYATHTTRFRRAGLIVGAYHFGVGFVSPRAQARAFLAVAAGADLLVLDLERDSRQTMTHAQAREFIATIHGAGRKVGLYHSRSGFPDLGQDYNWVAQWSSTSPTGIRWSFWQYQGSPLDRDRFNGDLAQLRALTGRPAPAPVPKPVPPPPAPTRATHRAIADDVNLRTGPSTSANVVRQVDRGAAVRVDRLSPGSVYAVGGRQARTWYRITAIAGRRLATPLWSASLLYAPIG